MISEGGDLLSSIEVDLRRNQGFDFANIYFITMFIVLCFYSTSEADRVIEVFHINAGRLLPIIGISFLFIFVSLFKKQRIDNVLAMLIISAILGIVPYAYSTNINSYWGNYIPLLITIVSYYICMQSKGDNGERIYKALCLVSIIISVQVILTEYSIFSTLSFGNFNTLSAKGAMNIPIGSSNLIAAFLLPIVIFLISYKPNKWSYLVVSLSVYALILCRSKNVFSLLLLLLVFFIAKKLYGYIFRDNSARKEQKLIAILVVTIMLGGILTLGFSFLMSLITDLQFTSYNSTYSNSILNYVDELTSGRIAVYHDELIRASNHLFWGNGFGYNLGDSKSHNWILELLVQKGLVGLFIYLLCIFIVLKIGLVFYKTDKFVRASINLLLIVYIQGLFEITVFTVGIDFLIWSIAGFMIARVLFLRRNEYKAEQEEVNYLEQTFE